MNYSVSIMPEAETDLDEIYDYISYHFLSKEAARNTLENIRLSIKILEDYPEIGIDVSQRLKKPFSKKHNLRMIISGSYLVFYIIDNNDVAILRVLYQSRNWIEIFGS
ncbi:MAG: type II toxin-antitoxin system RelE/ParE family toxin [Oscillospiraceae bacterium]|nr:type II toxin-antitoxin system RelE/ParE family toxin [Oscillospiraceae bacterium]